MGESIWIVSSDPLEAAVSSVVGALQQVRSPSPRLAVAGGSALSVLGAVRRQMPARAWRQLRLTWVDERCVPFDHPDSSRGQAERAGHLDPARPPAVHLPLYLDGETQADACRRVDNALRHDFDGALDVLLLGMGEDGHIASLFPGSPQLQALERVVAVADSPKPPPQRITLTLPLLRSTSAILLAVGEGKRHALEGLRASDPTLPASHLEQLTVVTDLQLHIEG